MNDQTNVRLQDDLRFSSTMKGGQQTSLGSGSASSDSKTSNIFAWVGDSLGTSIGAAVVLSIVVLLFFVTFRPPFVCTTNDDNSTSLSAGWLLVWVALAFLCVLMIPSVVRFCGSSVGGASVQMVPTVWK